MVHARHHIDPQKLRATHTGRPSQAHAGGYGTDPAQIGVLRPTAYWAAMRHVYRQCYADPQEGKCDETPWEVSRMSTISLFTVGTGTLSPKWPAKPTFQPSK